MLTHGYCWQTLILSPYVFSELQPCQMEQDNNYPEHSSATPHRGVKHNIRRIALFVTTQQNTTACTLGWQNSELQILSIPDRKTICCFCSLFLPMCLFADFRQVSNRHRKHRTFPHAQPNRPQATPPRYLPAQKYGQTYFRIEIGLCSKSSCCQW